MKLKLIALGVLLSISSVGFAMDYKTIIIPDAPLLQYRLENRGWGGLAEKTLIVVQLDGREWDTFEIAATVSECFYDYCKGLKKEKHK